MNKFANESDDVCVASVARGDQTAYSELVNRYGDKVFNLANRMLINGADAEDAVQEVFEKIWRDAKNWTPGQAKYSTWLYKVTFNHCMNLAKRDKKFKAQTTIEEHTELPSADDPFTNVLELQRRKSLLKAIKSLPLNQRTAITLVYGQGLNLMETSEILDLSLKATESLLMRAKKRIRILLCK